MITQKPIFLIIVAILSSAMGIFFYLSFDHSITDDAYQYKTIAQNLLLHKVYSLSETPPYLPTGLREPAYPVFLAALLWLFKGNYAAIYLTQIILFVLTVILVYYLSSKIFGEKMARWITFITALCPTLSDFPSYLLTETLFSFLIVLFMAIIFKAVESNKPGWYICSGIILAISTLTKSITFLLFIPIIFAGLLYCGNLNLFFKRYFKNFIIFTLSFFVIIAPWSIRNYNKFGKPVPSLLSGRALWIRGVKLDYNFKDIKKELVFSVSEYIGKKLYPEVKNPNQFLLKEAIVNEEKINEWAKSYNEAEIYSIQLKEALAKIRQHPLKYLAQNFIEWLKMTSFLYIPVLNEPNTIEKFGNMENGTFLISAIRGIFKLLAYLVLFLALFGLFGERKKWRQWIFIGVLILYINLVYSFLFGWGRYNVPFIPFYFMFAVAGFNFIRHKLSHNVGD